MVSTDVVTTEIVLRDRPIFRTDLKILTMFGLEWMGSGRQDLKISRGVKNPYTAKYHLVSLFHQITLSR